MSTLSNMNIYACEYPFKGIILQPSAGLVFQETTLGQYLGQSKIFLSVEMTRA
jgi:hypothetical protein